MAYAKLRIEQKDERYPLLLNLYLNDMDIGKYVRSFTIEAGVGQMPVATIQMYVKPEIPEGLIAMVNSELVDPLGLLDKAKEHAASQEETS